MRFRSPAPALSLAASLLAGCYHGLTGDGAAAHDDGGDAGDAGDEGDPGEVPPAASCAATDPTVPATPMRLLTRYEYDNTVRDLLGDTTRPAQGFAPENHSGLFENDAVEHQVSKDVVRQYLDAAEGIAARAVAERLATLVPCDPAVGDASCGHAFVETLLPRAFRRPVDLAERNAFVALFDAASAQYGFGEGIAITLQAVLQSPQFLYRIELDPPGAQPGDRVALSNHELATRLSYFLTASMPDTVLRASADAGELDDPEALELQARRLLESDGARETVAQFHRQWLGLGALGSVAKDPAAFPGLDPSTFAGDWNDSLQQFIAHVFFDGDATLSQLFSAPEVFLTPELAAFYVAAGQDPETGAWTIPGKHAGLLTQPGLMGLLAYPDGSSPVARGVFVRKRLLCQELSPPPGVAITPPAPDPNATTRERFEQHSTDPACAGCHRLIDPIGFAFENYDGAGRWRTTENGTPIDASGELVGLLDADAEGEMADAAALSARLLDSRDLQSCMVQQWSTFALGRGLDHELEPCTVAELQAQFDGSGGDLRELLVAIVRSDAFRYRTVQTAGEEGAGP
ncbi:MAG: DUF1592 domain-containing protein [Nannocystaceae bacterium]|nr:DUF1592 domain-containing protein [Nannocystaceae bacterium]